MKYLVINKETYEVLISDFRPRLFTTKSGAKRALTSKIKRTEKQLAIHKSTFYIELLEQLKTKAIVIDEKTFEEKEPIVIKKCLNSGKMYYERLNTPDHLSRASETFWAM